MSISLALYLALTLTLAGVVLTYVANVWRALDPSAGSFHWRAVALAPVQAWRLGARALPISFGVLVLVYALLQLSTRWVVT